MELEQFDDLTRRLGGAGSSRRQALRALAGAVLGSTLGDVATRLGLIEAAAAKPKRKKRKAKPKRQRTPQPERTAPGQLRPRGKARRRGRARRSRSRSRTRAVRT